MHPKKLGRYELVAVLGKGAMGVVYEGRDPNLDRRVAIKTIMVDDLARDAAAEYEARFRTEARSAARLQHPNIVSVYDSDRDGDTAYLVMEFVLGEDLKRHLDRGERFALPEALRLVQDLLAALDFAHAQGIVHRDIKPANLLVEPGGRLKLTDFGVARITGEATRTQGSMVGTLKYMAPEQVQGQKVDARADQFSAAVVAYQLFTGARPFDGDNDFSIIHQIIGLDPPAPSTLVAGLPPAVDAVIAQAMAKQREHRFATAGEFQSALQAAFATGGVAPAPYAPLRVLPAPAGAARPAPTVPGGSTAAGAPITQELELEYWRDVRDATDPRELEGFLQRFPHGVYADLARRRLERLGVADPDPDRTVLQGFAGTSPRPAAQAAVPLPPAAGGPTQPAPVEPAGTLPVEPAAAVSDAPWEPTVRQPTPGQAPATRRPAWMLPGGLALLVLAGAAAWMVQSSRTPVAPQPAAGLPSGFPAPVAAPTPVPAPVVSTSAVEPPAPAAKASEPAAAAPTRPASAVAARPARRASQPAAAAAPPAAVESRRPAPEPAPAAPAAGSQPPPTAAAPAAARPVSPAETCKDRMFLARQLCLREECAKPANQNFPVCVKMREEDRLREDSRVRN